jgi:hypothetical protein
MPESLGPILEREGRSVRLPDDAFEGLLRRRDRTQRRRRLAAAATAAVVAAALLAGVMTAALDRAVVAPDSQPITSDTVASLHEVWSAQVGDTTTPAITGSVVAEANRDGRLEVFPVDCQTSCEPLWTADVGAMPVQSDTINHWIEWWPAAADQPNAGYRHGSVTAVDGVIYVVSADGTLRAFDANCRDDGGTCQPLWTAATGDSGPDTSLPIVADGRVLVSGNAGIVSFAVGCAQGDSRCQPLWHRPIVGAVRVQDGHIYVTEVATGTTEELDPQTGATMWTSVPHRCCGNTPTPVRLGDRIYVNYGHLLVAYPIDCSGSCAPTWSTPIPDRFSDGPQLVGDTLVLSTAQVQQAGGLWIIPLACVDRAAQCRQDIRATTQQPVSSGTDVFASSTRNGGFWIFDTATCSSGANACLPAGSAPPGSVLAPYTPVVVGDLVFVADRYGPLWAFDAACTARCSPLWSSPGMRASGVPLISGPRVFVADKTGVLHAYATGGPVPVPPSAASAHPSPGIAPWFYLGLAVVIVGVSIIRRRRRAAAEASLEH